MITLTKEERTKLTQYLNEQALSERGIAEQMKSIKVPDFVVQKRFDDAEALTKAAIYVGSWATQEV